MYCIVLEPLIHLLMRIRHIEVFDCEYDWGERYLKTVFAFSFLFQGMRELLEDFHKLNIKVVICNLQVHSRCFFAIFCLFLPLFVLFFYSFLHHIVNDWETRYR